MKLIPLTRGYSAMVDDADYVTLNQHLWYADVRPNGSVYAVRSVGQSIERMHRVVIGASPDRDVDHIDHNGLNNQRSNLRECTMSQNLHNRQRFENNSGYVGVYMNSYGRWRGVVCQNRKRHYAGTFDTPEEAARARDKLAVALFGDYATLNFPGGTAL
jgi:hypothetical protein